MRNTGTTRRRRLSLCIPRYTRVFTNRSQNSILQWLREKLFTAFPLEFWFFHYLIWKQRKRTQTFISITDCVATLTSLLKRTKSLYPISPSSYNTLRLVRKKEKNFEAAEMQFVHSAFNFVKNIQHTPVGEKKFDYRSFVFVSSLVFYLLLYVVGCEAVYVFIR